MLRVSVWVYKDKSAETAFLLQKEPILGKIEANKQTLGIFVDFKEVFDLLNHEILIYKLQKYGIHGIPLPLPHLYLRY